jgi:hypothetical protein
MVTISKKNTKLVLPKEYEADTKVNIRFPLPFNRPLLLFFEKNIKLNQFAWKPNQSVVLHSTVARGTIQFKK